ncbi:MAG: hypothetical protein ACRDPD_18610 [Streptosporangiaceae bacterium]
MPILMVRLLWDPLPDSLPSLGWRRFPRLRELAAAMTGSAALASAQEQVNRRVRRGAAQRLVREAYLAAVAEQDSEHRPPPAFAEAWRAHLAGLLDQASADLPGWGPVTIADLDTGLAWRLYELASRARQDAIEHAAATPSQRVRRGQQVPTFEFSIVSDGDPLGDVTYGTCESCGVGLLYKIGFPDDWQFCGLGRLALGQLEARHPDLSWYTTGQFKHAQGGRVNLFWPHLLL